MSCLSKEDERGTPKGPYTTEYWEKVSPYCYVSTDVGDGDLDLGLSSWLLLSSSKAGHTPALPGREPARSSQGSSATLEDIWSPSQWAEIGKGGKGG